MKKEKLIPQQGRMLQADVGNECVTNETTSYWLQFNLVIHDSSVTTAT
jgi:hypothetical protein